MRPMAAVFLWIVLTFAFAGQPLFAQENAAATETEAHELTKEQKDLQFVITVAGTVIGVVGTVLGLPFVVLQSQKTYYEIQLAKEDLKKKRSETAAPDGIGAVSISKNSGVIHIENDPRVVPALHVLIDVAIATIYSLFVQGASYLVGAYPISDAVGLVILGFIWWPVLRNALQTKKMFAGPSKGDTASQQGTAGA